MSVAVDQPGPVRGTREPRWWTGTPPLNGAQFTVDARDYRPASKSPGSDDLQTDPKMAERMREAFRDTGLVHVTHTGLSALADMRRLAMIVIDTEMLYEGGANPRANLTPNVYEVGAPLTAWLHYHHEMAYIGQSTSMLGFLCHKTVAGRGDTYVSDNLQATGALLETAFGRKLQELGLCYHRNLTDREAFQGRDEIGVYNHWQRSMRTEDPQEAETKARELGLEVEWGPDRLMKTRYTISAFEYFPQLDRNVLFSSVADDAMWFDSWPKVMHLADEERPLKLTFGDGTPMTREEKAEFVDVYDRFGMPIPWQPGDVAVVCNYRFAHGRPGIHLRADEQRELGVVMGKTFDRVGDIPGKW